MHATQRRKFTDAEKRSILIEAGLHGTNVTLYRYKLSYSVFSRWKKKFKEVEAQPGTTHKKILQHLREVIAENDKLKTIIANQALEIQIKTEKLKVQFPKSQ